MPPQQNQNPPQTPPASGTSFTPPNAPPKIAGIRTFADDVADTVKSGQGSLTKIALAEEERRRRIGAGEISAPLKPGKRIALITFSALAVITGIAILIFVFVNKPNGGTRVAKENTLPKILLSDKEKELTATGSQNAFLKNLLAERDRTKLSLGEVLTFSFTKEEGSQPPVFTTAEFSNLLDWNAPDNLLRSLHPYFAFGIHGWKRNEPFLVLKIRSYQNVFAGMLEWENSMKREFSPLFIRPPKKQDGSATTTETLLRGKNQIFEDAVIKNKDARVLRDTEGNIILLYVFQDKETLIITTNVDTLKAVQEKILAGRTVR